ncbi:MAG: hypothetical protein WBP45_05635 [Daejeonella sp.]
MKKIFYPVFIMLGIITLTFSACKKDKTAVDDQDISYVQENAQADETLTDLFTVISGLSSVNPDLSDVEATKVQSDSKVNIDPSNDCAPTITITSHVNPWPRTVTFDFGDGCVNNGVTRKGKIIASFTKPFKDNGSQITITFNGFSVNNAKIEGTKTITNNGKNAAGNYTFSVLASKININSNGASVSWNSNKTIEWLQGESTQLPEDDIFSITGTASGTGAKGREFTVTITKPLIKNVACPFLIGGVLEVKSGEFVRTLDYGSDDCDAKAIISIKGTSKEIILKK